MNPTDTLTTLFSHNLWANLRLLERCAELTDEQLDASISGVYGSIRDTLQHMVMSEHSYFVRIKTGQPYHRPDNPSPLTIVEMMESLRASGSDLVAWASKVGANDVVQVDWEGSPRNVPKTIFLTQVINHATEHRTQIASILTHLGIEPPDVDAWAYFDEMDT